MSNLLATILTPDQRRALDNVRAAAERIWARPLHRYYTDHTPQGHSTRVIALLDGLTAGMMTSDKRMAPGEAFVLLAAAYLHDIGMQNEKFAGGDLDDIRDAHHEQTAEMIYTVFEDPANAFSIPLAGDPTVAEAVALVAKGHRRVDLATAAEYDPLVHGEETLRLRLLAALVRFGDELDIDHRRVDMEQLKLMPLPEESLLHWWKCHYVSGVSIQDEYIHIAYRFPQDRRGYEDLIVPLVEGDVRARHAELEEIFRANAVKVALGKSQVRLMRLVQPLPPEGERLAREKVKGDKGKGSKRAEEQGSQKQAAEGKPARPDKVEPVQLPATTVFDQRGQTVGTQINVAGDYVEQRPSGGTRYEIHIEHASGLAIGDGAQVVQASSKSGDRGDTDAVTPLRRQLVEAEANLALIQERKTQYVLEVDVPLQLIKEERRLLARIADLKEKLGKQA